jgi:hypothetical protein
MNEVAAVHAGNSPGSLPNVIAVIGGRQMDMAQMLQVLVQLIQVLGPLMGGGGGGGGTGSLGSLFGS